MNAYINLFTTDNKNFNLEIVFGETRRLAAKKSPS